MNIIPITTIQLEITRQAAEDGCAAPDVIAKRVAESLGIGERLVVETMRVTPGAEK